MAALWTTRLKFPLLVIALQIIFIVLFAISVDYDDSASPKISKEKKGDDGVDPVTQYYPMFQDVHVMIFIGFGFLMTFLKRYGFSSVGLNMMVAALVLQWATLVLGYVHNGTEIKLSMTTLLTSDFAAAAILITFGAVLGKVSAVQLVIIAMIEVCVFAINEWLIVGMFKVSDIGGSMVVHAFGAYFGLALARVLYVSDIKESNKEGSVYHSDMFAMIGTIFLWLFWPSFNSAMADGDARNRAVINTYFALASCCITTFALSAFLDRAGKFDMVHIQNATLAGGVAVGTSADMMIGPYGALLIGMVAGILSTVGFKYVTPFMRNKLKLHDTCGVNNLHGMPGLMAGFVGAIVASMATMETYGRSLFKIFPARVTIMMPTDGKLPAELVGTPVAAMFIKRMEAAKMQMITVGMNSTLPSVSNASMPIAPLYVGRTAGEQAGFQALGVAVTVVVAIVGGLLTGFIVKYLPFIGRPRSDFIFEDGYMWGLPEEEDQFDWTKNKAELVTEMKYETKPSHKDSGKGLLSDSDEPSPYNSNPCSGDEINTEKKGLRSDDDAA